MAIEYFASANVHVYPCANRGTNLDLESKINTEYNIVNPSSLLSSTSNYTISLENSIVKFVLHGYYFEVNLASIETSYSSSDVYVALQVANKALLSSDSTITTQALCKYEDTSSFVLDNTTDNKFYGLAYQIVDPDANDPFSTGYHFRIIHNGSLDTSGEASTSELTGTLKVNGGIYAANDSYFKGNLMTDKITQSLSSVTNTFAAPTNLTYSTGASLTAAGTIVSTNTYANLNNFEIKNNNSTKLAITANGSIYAYAPTSISTLTFTNSDVSTASLALNVSSFTQAGKAKIGTTATDSGSESAIELGQTSTSAFPCTTEIKSKLKVDDDTEVDYINSNANYINNFLAVGDDNIALTPSQISTPEATCTKLQFIETNFNAVSYYLQVGNKVISPSSIEWTITEVSSTGYFIKISVNAYTAETTGWKVKKGKFNVDTNGSVITSGAITSGAITCGAITCEAITSDSTITATTFAATSDKRLKENITAYIPEKSILDLPVYKYDFIDGPKNQIGCIAQDLQEICPEIVQENNNGYLSIQESKLVYLLLDEVKKLRAELDELKRK